MIYHPALMGAVVVIKIFFNFDVRKAMPVHFTGL